MIIKNLSQFKKWLAKGKQIQFIENTIKPERANGQIREVDKVQTNSFTTLIDGKDSWLDIPKATDMKFNDDGTIDVYLKSEFWLKIKPILT